MNLLDRVKSGDRDALDEFIRIHRTRLDRHAHGRIGASLRARVRTSDLLQATYLDVLQSLPGFRGTSEDELAAWIVRILENNIRDAHKYFGAQKRTLEDGGIEVPMPEDLPGTVPTPSSDAAYFDEVLLVSRAISRLPDEYQKVILLRLRPETSHREIAQEIDRTETASRVLLCRARAALIVELDRVRSEAAGD